MAGQADVDRTCDTARGVRRAPDHHHSGLAGVACCPKLGMHHRTQAAAYAVRAFDDHPGSDDGESHLGFSATR